MKKISFVIPCYNSDAYMKRAIDSLLGVKKDIEIIIINDGSADKTKQIAMEYQKKYPDTVKVVNKKNGGHGSGVNKGLEIATGLYFKVLDSDDWLDKKALSTLIKNIDKIIKDKEEIDLIICNYVYDHLNENKQKVMSFKHIFPKKVCTWNDMRPFRISEYLIMHSLIYKTSILKDCKLKLPEHTFYVDNIVAYKPLSYVKNIIYYDLDLYHYFIGRIDQSVNEKVMISRVDQQISVTKILLKATNLENILNTYPKLYRYLIRMLSMMVSISCVYLLLDGSKEALEKRDNLWNYIKDIDNKLYLKLRYSKMAGLTYLPTKIGRIITLTGYKIAKKVYKFN